MYAEFRLYSFICSLCRSSRVKGVNLWESGLLEKRKESGGISLR
jgi:hypothetical protein